MFYLGGYDDMISTSVDGVNEAIGWGDVFDRNLSDSFTINCWIYATAATNQIYLAKQNNPLSNPGYSCGFNSQGRPEFFFVVDGTNRIDITTTGPNGAINTWFMHTFVWDGSGGAPFSGSNLTIYTQGTGRTNSAVTDTLSSGTTTNASALVFGSSSNLSSALAGRMADFSFWSVAMSASEVSQLYNSGRSWDIRGHTQSANLDFWWTGGSGDTPVTATIDEVGGLTGSYSNMEVGDVTAGGR